MFLNLDYDIYYLAYEGEETETPTPEPEVKEGELVPQKKVNELLQKEKQKYVKQIEERVKELEEIKKSQNLTEKQKENLETKIQELQKSLLTKEELAQKEKEKLEVSYKEQVKNLSGERDTWMTRYNNTMIKNQILSSASKEDAYDPNQFIPLLKDNCRVVELTTEDGKSTDEFTVKVNFTDYDKEGKPINLDLTVPETIKRMKDQPERFGNLFKAFVSGGIGGNSNSDLRTGKTKLNDVIKGGHEAYMKNRKEIKEGKLR